MRHIYWSVPAISLAIVLLVASLLAGNAQFSFEHPRAPGMRFTSAKSRGFVLESRAETGRRRSVSASTDHGATHDGERLLPRVVVEQTVHDFGIMNPLNVGEHVFVIRNEGDAPLRLSDNGTSCKCTFAHLPTAPVPPGGSAEVRIQWNTGNDPVYAHSAWLATNDPQQPEIELRVEGKVQVLWDAIPRSVQFPDQDPGTTSRSTVILYSRTWKQFSIASGRSTPEGITWEARPLDEERGNELGALSGYELELTAPADLPKGAFHGALHLELIPYSDSGEPEESRVLELEVAGRVHSRISVFGSAIDETQSLVQLGVAAPGEQLHKRLVVRLRDPELPRADQIRLEVEPKHLRAELCAHDSSATKGIYMLDLIVPADAPEGAFLGSKHGTVRIVVDHPRIPELALPVSFAVVRR